MARSSYLIVKVDPFEGDYFRVDIYVPSEDGDQWEETGGSMYVIANRDTGEILDHGYRSMAEASKAYPEAVNAKRRKR